MSEVSVRRVQYYFHTHIDNVHDTLDHHHCCLQDVLMMAIVEEEGNAGDLDGGEGEDLPKYLPAQLYKTLDGRD